MRIKIKTEVERERQGQKEKKSREIERRDEGKARLLTLVLLRWFQKVTLCVTGNVPWLSDGLQLLVELIL